MKNNTLEIFNHKLYEFDISTILDEYTINKTLSDLKRFLDNSMKKYIKECYASEFTNKDNMINITLYCKDDSGWKYSKIISIAIFNKNQLLYI